ncbi:hypothetical protein PpBr36_08118 [Pyricularia pennisetigena]|uniref:hypothetical protein n=1 Tax=Pyricularia pennisetigena TaxID=1578925 RepID=UPI00114E6164|nr:hypothetical protein PpBr36_08118 [Pyricularia pennisetigena]TLS24464.1 hypothetical protein PpBr36_08118 [Pyricularia pennisetigena]
MPQDPNLYGQPAPKRQRKEMDLSSSLSFAAQMSSLLQKPGQASPSTSSSARPRPSKTSEIFKTKRNTTEAVSTTDKSRSGRATSTSKKDKLRLRSPTGTYDSERDREAARLNMEEKARRYAAMKRGDYIPPSNGDRAPLVDFDRKWAEKHLDEAGNRIADASSSSSSSDDDDDDDDDNNNDTELVTYTDEFGRARRVTRAQARRLEQRARSGLAAAAELVEMSARPAPPQGLIFGDAIQGEAFAAADAEAMESLARKRDRSATPPPATHYDARREMRGRGVGFYSFTAGDEEARRREMEGLEAERRETERVRAEREEKARARREDAERRRREIEERRRQVGEKRAKKLAENFLDGLGMDLGGSGVGDTGAAVDPAVKEQKDGGAKNPDGALPDGASRPGGGTEADDSK